ncbi:MAG: hypothetical protein ACOCWA_08390 [Bacteroidota bacterium]
MNSSGIKIISRSFRINSLMIVFSFSLIITGCFKNKSDFTIEDRSRVDFIGIYGKDSVELTRKDTVWMLNDELKPDPTAVENFIYAFENIDITGATTGEDLDTLISRKIVIKEGPRSKILRFYASTNYYLLHHEGTSELYRIKVLSAPEANLEKIFSDNPAEWLSHEFISVEPGELQELRVIPQARYGKGFVMRKDSSGFAVFDLEGNEIGDSILDTEKTLLYASYLDEIYFTEEITEDSIIARINNSEPFYEFFIKETAEAGYSFGVYELYNEKGERDLFHGIVKYSGKKPVLKLNYANLDPLFQDLDYFTVE